MIFEIKTQVNGYPTDSKVEIQILDPEGHMLYEGVHPADELGHVYKLSLKDLVADTASLVTVKTP